MKIILCSLICLCLCGCFRVAPEKESNVKSFTNYGLTTNDINMTTQAFSKNQVVHVYGGGELEINLDKGYAIYNRDGKIICDKLPEFIVIKQKEK